jgi:hypothetical protein
MPITGNQWLLRTLTSIWRNLHILVSGICIHSSMSVVQYFLRMDTCLWSSTCFGTNRFGVMNLALIHHSLKDWASISSYA